MSAQTAQLISQLPKLSQDELREIQLHAGALLSDDLTDDEKLVHDLINETVLDLVGTRGRQLFTLGDKHRRALRKGTPKLLAFAAEFKPKSRIERRKAMSLLVRVIARRMSRVSYGSIVVNLDSLDVHVEAELPGYKSSGLLPMLLTRSRENYGYDAD